MTTAVPTDWNRWGLSATMAAIGHYNHILHNKAVQLVEAAKTSGSKESLNEVAGIINCEPRHNIKYSHAKYDHLATVLKGNTPEQMTFNSTENSIRESISHTFPKPTTGLRVFIQDTANPPTPPPPKPPKKEKKVAPPKRIVIAGVNTDALPESEEPQEGGFPTSEEIGKMYKAALKAHPKIAGLDIDWTKNLNSVRAEIKKKSGRYTVRRG